MSHWPSLTIITPTEGRIGELNHMLASSASARAAYQGISEHVVTDSSPPEEAKIVRSMCEAEGVRFIPSPSRNVREKRNMACKAAQGELLVFLDSDVAVHQDCLVRHVEALGQAPGTLGVVAFVGKATFWNRIMEGSGFTEVFQHADRAEEARWGFTANAAIRKACFEAVGGFALDLPARLGGDDLDLTLRVTQQFGALRCAPLARCDHRRNTWGTARAALGRTWRWGRMEYHLMRRHPECTVPAPLRFWAFHLLALPTFAFLGGGAPLRVAALSVACALLSLVVFDLLMEGWPRLLLRSPVKAAGRAAVELLFELASVVESTAHRSFLGLGNTLLPDPAGAKDQQRCSGANARANLAAWIVTFVAGWSLWWT